MSDFRGLAQEHLRCDTLPFLGDMKVFSHSSAKMTSEKRERNVTLKKRTTQIKLLHYLLICWALEA